MQYIPKVKIHLKVSCRGDIFIMDVYRKTQKTQHHTILKKASKCIWNFAQLGMQQSN